MKFGKYYEKEKIEEWRFFYVDYKKLKHSLAKEKSTVKFYEIIHIQQRKLNNFITLIEDYDEVNMENICKFLVLNYMALFKSIKKHDKKLCKTTKIKFFHDISSKYSCIYKSFPLTLYNLLI